jgi:hypothetical protein
MVFLYINKKNYKEGSKNLVKELDDYMGKKNNKIFLLIFMEGCGPCNATRPEWAKLKNVLSDNLLKRDDIVVASIDHELCEQLENLNSQPNSFPTMRFITGSGEEVENYEDSNIENKDRTVDSFVEWIKSKSGDEKQDNTEKQNGGKKRKTRRVRNKRGGKWSAKYKRSINCKRPKGFSQRQYCKYGRKK